MDWKFLAGGKIFSTRWNKKEWVPTKRRRFCDYIYEINCNCIIICDCEKLQTQLYNYLRPQKIGDAIVIYL